MSSVTAPKSPVFVAFGVERHEEYWECRCAARFVHPKATATCPTCHARQEISPYAANRFVVSGNCFYGGRA